MVGAAGIGIPSAPADVIRRRRIHSSRPEIWSGWADLNRRPLAPEASALPLSHTPISEFTTAHPASVLLFRRVEKIARPGGRPDDLRPDTLYNYTR